MYTKNLEYIHTYKDMYILVYGEKLDKARRLPTQLACIVTTYLRA